MNVSNGETSTTFTFHLTSRTTASTLVTPTWKMRIWQLECPNRPKYRGSNAEKDFLMLGKSKKLGKSFPYYLFSFSSTGMPSVLHSQNRYC